MSDFTMNDVSLVEKQSMYKGFFSIQQYRLSHGLFAGKQSEVLLRECFERGHAVGVLAYDPWNDSVVLLEQFRIGAYVYLQEKENTRTQKSSRENKSPWLLEIIAGIVEPNEENIDVARREAKEEAGIELLALEIISEFYSSPGGSSEITQLYCACVHSDGLSGTLQGLAEEGEDIRVQVYDFSTAIELLKNGRLNNASTIISLQWLMLNHNNIRDQWSNMNFESTE